MIRRSAMMKFVWAAWLVLAPASLAGADPITVLNASFEDPALVLGASNGAIPNWDITGGSGVFHPPAAVFPSVPDGVQTAYNNDGTISQTLADTLESDTQYTLTVYVGRRLDFPDLFPGYSVELYAGATLLGSASVPLPNPGEFVPVIVTYESLASSPEQLRIVLSSLGIQTNFDNVSLDAVSIANPVPEPATAALLIPGLILVGLARAKRHSKASVR